MKKLLTLTIGVLLAFSINAQDYIPFPDSLATWNVSQNLFDFNDGINEYFGLNFHLEGDTLVNDTSYSKLFVRRSYYSINGFDESYSIGTNAYILLGGIREDSSKKVWFKNMNFDDWDSEPWPEEYFSAHYFFTDDTSPLFDQINESNEVLLYDFGLQVGDSILFPPEFELFDPYYGIVEEISIDILGRNTIKFSNPQDCFAEQCGRIWVEGIGEINSHPFSLYDINEIYGLVAEYGNNLVCFWENGEQIYTDSDSEYLDNCENLIVGIGEIEIQSLAIYPNPGNGEFSIQLPAFSPRSGLNSLQVINALGEIVFSDEIYGVEQYQFDLSNQPNGIYAVVLESEKGNYSSRIIKE